MDKRCNKCSEIKPVEEFFKNRNSCKTCFNICRREYRSKNKDKVNINKKNYYRKNREKILSRDKKYYEKNRDVILLKQRDYYEKIKNKPEVWTEAYRERVRETSKIWAKVNSERKRKTDDAWGKRNPDKINAKNARRRAVKLKRTPVWSEKFFIDEIYHLAKIRTELTGIKWHVDHIIPLNSEYVSGLHCETNLQVIPAKENISKGNRYWPDMWQD